MRRVDPALLEPCELRALGLWLARLTGAADIDRRPDLPDRHVEAWRARVGRQRSDRRAA
jgi:hypothetical protein